MKPNNGSNRLIATSLLLATLASGCASSSPSSPPAVVLPPVPVEIPPLPPQAQQPSPPPICSPSCSAGLMRLRTTLLDSLTEHLRQAPPASAPTGEHAPR